VKDSVGPKLNQANEKKQAAASLKLEHAQQRTEVGALESQQDLLIAAHSEP
jgi:hypothetical protein